MSFSGEMKEELLKVAVSARHCQIAELAAIYQFLGRIKTDEYGNTEIYIQTENEKVAARFYSLWKKVFKVSPMLTVRRMHQQTEGLIYLVRVTALQEAKEFFMLLHLERLFGSGEEDFFVDELLIKNSCCKRAFLRGAFLVIGSVSDPQKGYHLELVCHNMTQANKLITILQSFGIQAKYVLRKKYYVIYLKDGEQISDFLNVISAHMAMMEFENARIVKDVRNRVNRKFNCDMANINKMVNAASKQMQAIQILKDKGDFDSLPDSLKEIARLREEYPESSLEELGKYSDPPIGKSGVNHRLRKLVDMAKEYGEFE